MPDSDKEFDVVSSTAVLEEHDLAFLGHLIAEVETPLDGHESRASRTAIVEKLKHKSPLTQADLYEMDRLTLELESDQEVVSHAPGLYQRYCQERGLANNPNDPSNNPPPAGDPNEKARIEVLRARALEVLRALHWSYTFGPIREKIRVSLIKDSIKLMAVSTLLTGGLVALFRAIDQPFLAMLTTILYAGVMGGGVSCARRLGNVSTTDDAFGSIIALKNSRYVLISAPITGAVFAVIAMLLFVSDVLSGPLFPSFPKLNAAGPVTGAWGFVHSLMPSNSAGYALLFLWCFIAGFAERFIPDTLDTLTKRAATPKQDSAKQTAAPTR